MNASGATCVLCKYEVCKSNNKVARVPTSRAGADPEILERGGPPMVNYGKEGDQYVKYI